MKILLLNLVPGAGRYALGFFLICIAVSICAAGCGDEGANQGAAKGSGRPGEKTPAESSVQDQGKGGTDMKPQSSDAAVSAALPQAPSGSGQPVSNEASGETAEVRTPLPEVPDYMEGTAKASPGTLVLKAALGSAEGALAGMAEDPDWVTDGFPPAYDVAPDGSIHVLDSAKGRIAVFTGGALSGTVDIGPISRPDPAKPRQLLSDLSFGGPAGYAVLDQTSGRVVIIDPRGVEKYFVEGLKGATEIYLAPDGVLFVLIPWAGEEGKARIMRFDGEGTMTGMYEAHGIKPWPAGDFLYFLEQAEPVSLMKMGLASSTPEKAAVLTSIDNHMDIHATPVLGAFPDGRVAVVLLMSRPAAPGSHDETQIYRKAIALFGPDGAMTGHSDFPQPFVECKFTPRLHRLGSDGSVYTLIPRAGFYEIFRKSPEEFKK